MAMLVVLPLVLVMLPLAAPFPPWQRCGGSSSGNYTAGSKYQANLQLLSTTLPSDASSSPALFAKSAVGAEPDQVFGLALCRGDTNASYCLDCATRAFRDAQSLCPYRKEAAIYEDLCLAFFSGDDFLDSTANMGQIRLYNVSSNSPTNTTDAGFVTLVGALLTYTMQWAMLNSTASKWYGTVRMSVVTPPLYSLMQCTPDMSGGDCRQCLQDLVGNSTFNGSTAGVLNLGVRCSYSYETYQFYSGQPMLTIGSLSQLNSTVPPPSRQSPPSPSPAATSGKKRTNKLLIVAVLLPLIATSCVLMFCFAWIRRVRNNKLKLRQKDTATREEVLKLWRIEESNSDFMLFDFTQIEQATSYFSEAKKLGEGGFGSVYKGELPSGLEVAVKRLAAHSRQGLVEFKNEIQLIVKLQHMNLVNLRGCCIQGEENMLIYEYMPNKSLDSFIFDIKRAALLNWNRRLNIIEGITQGMLYLHRHSRLRIIHRDLKASNILLDKDMNPKISDFGLARIYDSTDTEGNTKRVVGTYGYMAPEYASEGCFSVKSDVFSYGVLLLEIISGKRNSGFHQCGDFFNLLGYAWQLWKDENWIEIVAPSLLNEGKMMEIKKCIKIALLCVQESAADRPTMSDIVTMLSSDELLALPEPKQPAFLNVRATHGELSSTVRSSVNDLTITVINGR